MRNNTLGNPGPGDQGQPAPPIPVLPLDYDRVPANSQGFQLGQGYNSLDSSTQGTALISSPGIASPDDIGPHPLLYTLKYASSLYELADKLSVSVTGSFNLGGQGANASFSYAKEIFTSETSLYVVVMVDVRNAAKRLQSWDLDSTPPGRGLQDAMGLTQAEFFNKYGDRFI